MATPSHEIVFRPGNQRARAKKGTTLLEAARSAGLPVASACGADGICGRCGMKILVGSETLPPEDENERSIKRSNRIDPTLRLSCRVRVESDLTVTATYW